MKYLDAIRDVKLSAQGIENKLPTACITGRQQGCEAQLAGKNELNFYLGVGGWVPSNEISGLSKNMSLILNYSIIHVRM